MTSNKILVRTLDVFNGNYGGILQAYALQRTLNAWGYEAWTDYSYPAGPVGRIKQQLKPILPRVLPSRFVPHRLAAPIVNEELDRFVRNHMQTIDLYAGKRQPSPATLEQFSTFIVGSDQVWRRDYADVPSFLLDFTAERDVRRIAYAASFGTDQLDGYDPALLARSRQLAQRLDAVSVRESSAVDLCRAHWQVSATHVLDPTMLLPASDYLALIEQAGVPRSSGHVLDFTLDTSDQKRTLVESIARELEVEIRSAMPPSSLSYGQVRRDPTEFRKPSVESWLQGFADADFVITDSFHGTAFSIIFQKPFIAITNASRGAARFTSLLESLGLEDRLTTPERLDPGHRPHIDWASVAARMEEHRGLSLTFLVQALGGDR